VSAFKGRAAAAHRKKSEASQDRVSADSTLALSVRAAEAEERTTRAERSKRLKRAVEDGSYRPNAEDIAVRMLDSAAWIVELDREIDQLTADAESLTMHMFRPG
jgi:anti-sigma28 factor (negative regulator of flagellin synthesis)